MADLRDHADTGDTGSRTVDSEAHGDTSSGNRQTSDGEIRTQRGDPDDLPAEIVALGYEPFDVSASKVSIAVLGLVGAVALSLVLVFGFLTVLRDQEHRPTVSRLATTTLVVPAPRLEVGPITERAAIEQRAQAQLQGYARLPEPNRARIPIERAMQLLAEHGWPDADDSAPSTNALPEESRGRASASITHQRPAMPIEQRSPREPPLKAPP